MKYFLTTLGCAKNTVDSMKIEQSLRSGRHLATHEPDEADVLIVNTCGFIDDAKDESIEVIKDLDNQRNEDQALYVVGCLTEIAEEQVKQAVPNVDQIFGAEAWSDIAASFGSNASNYDIPQPSISNLGGISAYLKLSDGCDRPCTFCIIPTIKGKMHSTADDLLIAEAKFHAAMGIKELVLVAQDSTAYGEDISVRDGLAQFLEKLSIAVPEIPWIRLMYAYPGRVTSNLARVMNDMPNILPYVDMPLQHGSDSMLRRMKGPSSRKARESISYIRNAMNDAVIRTTFIVGFPGETEQEFDELLQFIRTEQFEHIGVFTYSAQSGTPAALMQDQVDDELKTERYARVMELAQEISLSANQSVIGETVDILIESEEPTRSSGGDLVVVGRTYRDAPEVDGLAFVKGEFQKGSLVKANVDGALPYDLLCTPIDS